MTTETFQLLVVILLFLIFLALGFGVYRRGP